MICLSPVISKFKSLMILACLIIGTRFAEGDVVLAAMYDSLGATYVSTDAVTGVFTARAVSNLEFATYGGLSRLDHLPGDAYFEDGFVNNPLNPADIRIQLNVTKVPQALGAFALGTGTFWIVDADGDRLLGTLDGTFLRATNEFIFFNGSVQLFASHESPFDPNFNGTDSGSFPFGDLLCNQPREGFVTLVLNSNSSFSGPMAEVECGLSMQVFSGPSTSPCVSFGSGTPNTRVFFQGSRSDPGPSGPPSIFPFQSLDVLPGSRFNLGPNETLNLNNGLGTLYINPGATFYGNGTIIGNVLNAGLLVIPITRAGLISSIFAPSSGPRGVVTITTPHSPTPQPPVSIPAPAPPRINPGTFISIGGSGFSGTNGGSGGGPGGGSWPGWQQVNQLTSEGGTAWDGRLDVTGSFNQTTTGFLRMFIAGGIKGETYSLLHVGLSADVHGTLQIVLQPELFNFVPSVGDTFDFIEAMGGITLPALPETLTVQTLMTASGAAQLGLSYTAFNSGFAEDPNQLVVLPSGMFTYALVNGGTTLRATMVQPICSTIAAIPNQSICPGASVDMSATHVSSGLLAYQWQWLPNPAAAWINIVDGFNSDPQGGPFTFEAQYAQSNTITLSSFSGSSATGSHWDIRSVVTNACASVISNSATLAFCVGDYNCDGGIDGSDVEAFFTDWESGSSAADVNTDGGTDGSDVSAFFGHWEAGC